MHLSSADFTFGAALLTVLEVFLFVAWIWVLVALITDLFTDHAVSGWGKAGWCFLLIVLPFLGVLIYLIARGGSMQERAISRQSEARREFDAYIRHAAGASPAEELVKLAELRDRGAISEAEFERLKERLLTGDGVAAAR